MTFIILAIIFFTAGVVKLRLLRIYFKDFFKEFGCNLWWANIALTLPLMFRAFFDAMRSDWPAWNEYWIDNGGNDYRLSGYNMLLFFFGTYVPMLTQISTLIFGFVRNKQVKIFQSFKESNPDYHDDEEDE